MEHLSSFLNVSGYDYPTPQRGFTYVIATMVDAGRNVNGATIGQRIGRDIYKLNTLRWAGITASQRMMMLQSLENFYVPVTFEDYRYGRPITIIMYPGDRTGKPLWIDELTYIVTHDEYLAFNLIDTGR